MDTELLYHIALTMVSNIGPVQAKTLVNRFGSARAVFTAPLETLCKIENIGQAKAAAIRSFRDFDAAEKEMVFIQRYGIQPIPFTDKVYPQRLLNCYDSPTLLYYKGTADLNNSKIIAIVGTRTNSEYGRFVTEQLVADLASLGVLVVSGLASGIDAIAHRAALQNSLPTVGVLAHGLDQIYPEKHAELAREMIRMGGGLVTEFRSKTDPDRYQFPSRNRLVAGMSDATIVIETGVKGGSMITAELANGYNRDVFALPGKTTDPTSMGCNHLIRSNKACLIGSAAELMESMNWGETPRLPRKSQREIFIELTAEEQVLIDLLRGREAVHIDEINLKSGLSNSSVAAAILNMELQNVIFAKPGKRYSLL
ncbi:MAG: DNA-protecting protein DprA [Citrobacter freundii]|nr:MAG: DNA-protecting protein DprA [Citrobacter freundii]